MGRFGRLAAAAASAAAISLLGSASASAAFPEFRDCPLRGSDPGTCLDIQSRTGSFINIKGFNVPLHDTLRIRGGVRFNDDGSTTFLGTTSGQGFFGTPVDVPGGVLGINLPFGFDDVTAQAVLAGPTSSIRVDLLTLGLALPVKLKLTNTFFSSSCYIGSDRDPAWLDLITGTTNPPAPNRPISGSIGTITSTGTSTLITGNTNVDNSFAIPNARGCGLFNGGLIDSAVNLKMKLPSAGGNNTMSIANDVAIQPPQ